MKVIQKLKFVMFSLGVVVCMPLMADNVTKAYALQETWFEQPIDHTKPNSESFKQQVLLLTSNDAKNDANIFFVLGNETDSTFLEIENLYQKYGSPTNTVFILAEHRGYGQSQKLGDHTVPNYVSISQALTDDYKVLSHYKTMYSGRVMVAGYSYGGALATQFTHNYPDLMDATLNSSGPIHWPFMIPEYGAFSTAHLGHDFSTRLREHAESLKPVELFDENWRQRELLTAVTVGLTQRSDSQYLTPIIKLLSYLPTPIFAWSMDLLVPQKGKTWSDNRRAQAVSFEKVQSGEFNWYLWKYQQCYELGTFFNGGPFAQTKQDHLDDCLATFGKAATYIDAKKWDVASLIAKIKTPYVAVSGGKDPWIELGIKPDHEFSNVTYIYAEEGFHCPDRSSIELGEKVYLALLGQ